MTRIKTAIQKSVFTDFTFSNSFLTLLFAQQINKGRAKFPVSFFQIFWDDFCFTQDRHKIGISSPSRYNVKVDVFLSGAPHGSNIYPDIETMGPEAFC
jgi:hypothetical protein